MAEVKRGFRKVTCVVPIKAYEALKRMADAEMRTPDQQGAYLLLKMINRDPSTDEYVVEEVVESPAWSNGQAPVAEGGSLNVDPDPTIQVR